MTGVADDARSLQRQRAGADRPRSADRCRSCSTTCRPRSPHIKAGKLQALAVTSRNARRARCPTCRRSPKPGCLGSKRRRGSACSRPPARRRDVVAKVNGEVAKWLATPEAKEKLRGAGRDRGERPHAGGLRRAHRGGDDEVAEGREGLGREGRVGRRGAGRTRTPSGDRHPRGASPSASSTPIPRGTRRRRPA